jgi:hypothetical protein
MSNDTVTMKIQDVFSLRSSLDASYVEIDRLRTALAACVAALTNIESETKYYEQAHLRRVWKLARAAHDTAKAAMDGKDA